MPILTKPRGTWIDESLIDHDLLLNAAGLVNQHAQIDTFINTVPTTYLKLDASNDPLTGTLNSQSIIPALSANYDFGDSNNFFRTLYLNNQGGNVIYCKPIQLTGEPATNYTMILGGGQFGSDLNQGGTFTFKMNDIASSLGTSINQIVFDPGRPDVFAAGTTNDVIFQAFNGIATYGFVCAFGGFNDVQYGLELRRISGVESFAKTLIFDNQVPVSDFRRSIDFRINTVNKLTIENDGTVTVIDRITTPFITATVINNGVGIGTAGAPAVTFTGYPNFFGLNWFDYLTINAVITNLPVCLGMFPNGTATSSYVNVYNSSNTGATAWLEMGVRGTIAELIVRDFAQTTNITALNIGSGGNDFPIFDVTCTTLTDINFVFAGLTELTIQPDTLIFNNGAILTQIDWSVNGELGFQVATNNIIRISSTLAHIYQNTDVDGDIWLTSDNDRIYLGTGKDWDFYYDGTYAWIRTDLQNPSDLRLDCGTDKTLELQETVWKDINIGGVNLTLSAANRPDQVTIDTTSIITYAFDGAALTEEVSGAFELQHDYKEGTDIIPHVHWYPTTAGAGNVKWQLEYWIRINDTVKLTGTITITDAASGTAWTEERADFPAITGTTLLINAQIHFRLFRNPTDAADTYAADAAIGTIGIHYEINTMGSRQTLVK